MNRRTFLAAVTVTLLDDWTPANAQRPIKGPRIGWLTVVRRDSPLFTAFAEGLQEAGYAIDRNVTMMVGTPEHADRLDEFVDLATKLVTAGVDVVYAGGPLAVDAVARVTKTIPIVVIELESDPVLKGWVQSVARPGGNITGFFLDIPEMSGKQLQFLSEAKPQLSRVAVLGHPRLNELQFRATEVAAQKVGLTLQKLSAATVDEMPELIATAARRHAGALLVLTNPLVLRSLQNIADAAVKHQLPTICPFAPTFAEVGGLMAYGPDLGDLFRRAALYVARVLSGAKPADLPLQRPDKFIFAVNLRTAHALKLALPETLIGRANRVLE
jgi:putative ABC transport system substrate-binding protein